MAEPWFHTIPYFSEDELACPCCGEIALDRQFAAALAGFREKWQAPIIPTSICRCPDHNTEIGGHPRSLHLMRGNTHPVDGTAAIDVWWENMPRKRQLQFARNALSYGFTLGLSAVFVHLDWRARLERLKMPQAIFTYDDWHGAFSDEQIRN